LKGVEPFDKQVNEIFQPYRWFDMRRIWNLDLECKFMQDQNHNFDDVNADADISDNHDLKMRCHSQQIGEVKSNIVRQNSKGAAGLPVSWDNGDCNICVFLKPLPCNMAI
jgi:hypothetical protein